MKKIVVWNEIILTLFLVRLTMIGQSFTITLFSFLNFIFMNKIYSFIPFLFLKKIFFTNLSLTGYGQIWYSLISKNLSTPLVRILEKVLLSAFGEELLALVAVIRYRFSANMCISVSGTVLLNCSSFVCIRAIGNGERDGKCREVEE